MRWQPAYIGIGSNLGDPSTQVRQAIAALATLPLTRLQTRSSLYGAEPLGPPAQPQYVNAVAGLLTQLEVLTFFEELRRLEVRLGKQPPSVRWGARLIDLDLLLFGQQRVDSAQLRLPHPGIVQRNFVLYPLREVAPDLNVPGWGRVATLAAGVQSAGIWRLNDETTINGA